MKRSELKTIIRKMVRDEVAITIKEVINEITKPSKQVSKPKKKVVNNEKHYTQNSVINEILNETAGDVDWKTMGGGVQTTDDMANVMAKSYGDMMNGEVHMNVEQMAVESNVSPETVPDHVGEALTRDYSDLVKAMGTPGGTEKK